MKEIDETEKCYLEYVEGHLTCTFNHTLGALCLGLKCLYCHELRCTCYQDDNQTNMTTPSMRILEEMKGDYQKWCLETTVPESGLDGAIDTIDRSSDYWLQEIRQRDNALKKAVEGMKFIKLDAKEREEHPDCMYKRGGLYVGNVAGVNFNKALDQVLSAIPKHD